MSESRRTPIQQALACARLLREGWHDKSALARRLGVSERAVKRYLRAIADEEDGYEIREIDERGHREYRIRPIAYRERRRGSPYEVMALAMAERFFRAFDPGGVADLLDQVLYEVTGEEDEADEDRIDRKRRSLARRFVLARAPQPLPGRVRRVFDQVLRGLVDRRVLELRYHPRKGPAKDYVLRPYTLLLGEQELAITGALGEPPEDGVARLGDPIRTFALNRIEGLKLRQTRFSMPHLGLWDPEKNFEASWGLYSGPSERARVAIHPAFGELVSERVWHPSQQVGEPGPDGWIPIEFDVFVGGEFRTWVLGWGPWARVEEPASLASWVATVRALEPGEGTPDDDEVFRIV
ncbi:MAG: WYL domain-containing transcriptional regulator [Proteobacteria bacterium]|nr:WYL domain-containing transcriptional regulator [Pseudomonadota bacterium]